MTSRSNVAAMVGSFEAIPRIWGRRGRSLVARAGGLDDEAPMSIPEGCVSAIILAGGVGKRMGAAIPKQYLELSGQAIATYSMETFSQMQEIGELVVVCNEEWEHVFDEAYASLPAANKKPLVFARPGAERQDSVFNGLQACREAAQLVAIHDSARPLVTMDDCRNCMADGMKVGAAVLGVPVKPTIKQVNADGTVEKTLTRSKLWEVQTPQCIKPELLKEGFENVRAKNIEVTDDVSIIEAMGLPVLITQGSYTNIKVTTPEDMSVAQRFLKDLRAE